MLIRAILIFFLLFLFTLIAQVDSVYATTRIAKKTESGLFREVALRYQASPLVKMDVDKTVHLEALGKDTTYKAKVYISGSKFRWENISPEKTLLVFDGETLWNEQAASADFGGPPQVAKAKLDKRTKSQILLGSLLGNKNLMKTLDIVSEQPGESETVFVIKSKTEDPAMKDLKITVAKKEKIVQQMSFTDDVGNVTTMKFSNIDFQKNGKKELFKYQPPKGAQVTNL